MAFDKYILGILSFSLTQALWGLWLCQFCSKVFFFSVSGSFWSHLYAQYQSWSRFLLGLYSRQVDVTKKKTQLSIGTHEYLRGGSSWWQPGTSSPFLCLLLVIGLGSAQWLCPDETFLQRCSIPVLYTSGVLSLGRAIFWVQEQSKVSFDASQISQGTLPFLGSLFGEIISSKKSAFRRNLIQALVEEDELLAAKVQLFCCIINIINTCAMVHARVLQDSALVPLTPSLDFVTPVPVESVPGVCSQDRSGSGQGHLVPLCKRWCFQVLPYK